MQQRLAKLSRSSEAKEIIRYWRRVIIVIAFLLPLLTLVLNTLLETVPPMAQLYRWIAVGWFDVEPVPMPSFFTGNLLYNVLGIPAFVLLFAIICNWPFFVLAARVKHHVLRHWPHTKAGQEAIIGGLAGLLVPYLFYYLIALPIESLAAMQGYMSTLMILPTWVIAGLLAFLGLHLGDSRLTSTP